MSRRYETMTTPAAQTFGTLVYEDVAPEVLAREEECYRTPHSVLEENWSWQMYLRKVLPPVAGETVMVPPDPEQMNTGDGMARFLLLTGPGTARDLALGMLRGACAAQDWERATFWTEVVDELDRYGAAA